MERIAIEASYILSKFNRVSYNFLIQRRKELYHLLLIVIHESMETCLEDTLHLLLQLTGHLNIF